MIYKTLSHLKLFWFVVDFSVLLNEDVQFFFHDIRHFFVCIADCQSELLIAIETRFVKWIAEGINYLKNHPDVIQNSFSFCGITTNDPGKVRNAEFIKKIMNSVKDKLADEEKKFLRIKILFHVYNRLIMII